MKVSALFTVLATLSTAFANYTPQYTHFDHPEHLNQLPKPEVEFLFHLQCAYPLLLSIMTYADVYLT
jgi:hypothetical protein